MIWKRLGNRVNIRYLLYHGFVRHHVSLTFNNVTCLYYTCHQTSMSVNVFEATICDDIIFHYLCECTMCKLCFLRMLFPTAMFYLNMWHLGDKQSLLICKRVLSDLLNFFRYISSIVQGPAHFISLFLLWKQSQSKTKFS